ncbi:Protein of uncharacterised function (DUF3159) [Actinomyces bovis]|uniref:Protein of uncharacterized function (DUF3159) n=1 Tax=Actinomyces bovis TaxID=1658 RepID=A0ABY1VK33_9ACTO|nr:DUF3159 domain-containing protein [Actinomyces bovis]SPT52435.1 Protein of uncharacterised function (DUF3159) [Actinomyces bovis]VEG54080.1 Protein of uncharacterised function (DUF3159) [Actinomyces israelii]
MSPTEQNLAAANRTGLSAIDSERFDASAAVGGWRGVVESMAPTLVFILVLAVQPKALVPALVASLALSAIAMVVRLLQRQGLTQVLGGAALAGLSALWAWRSGEASNFYATGLIINAGWLSACLLSLLLGFPLVGVLMELWHRASGELAGASEDADDGEQAQADAVAAETADDTTATAQGQTTAQPTPWFTWRQEPAQRGERRRYYLGTAILAAMFALRLVVEVPLYLAGDKALGALGLARLALGVPLFALTLWFVWLVIRPAPEPAQR